MTESTIAFGIALVIKGMLFYIGTDTAGLAAVVPPLFGTFLLICGLLAFKENLRRHALQVAAVVGGIGLLTTISGFIEVTKMLAGMKMKNPAAVVEQGLSALLFVVFLVLCLRSFIHERRDLIG